MGFVSYDFVVYLMFDEKTSEKIFKMKKFLENSGIENTERPWPPHITLDLYDNISEEELIEKIQKIAQKISAFDIEFKKINKFGKNTLYLQPDQTEKLTMIKNKFVKEFKEWQIGEFVNQHRSFVPHVTLAINDDVTQAEELMSKRFKPFSGTVNSICAYDFGMNLVYRHELKQLTKEKV